MRKTLSLLSAALTVGATLTVLGFVPAASAAPDGPPGNWVQVFADEFNGTALDTSRWTPNEGGQINDVTTHAANVTEGGGHLTLTLAGRGSGATINSDVPGGYHLAVGEYVEASVFFHGAGGTLIADWPAWWVSGPDWPNAGEHDIAEGLGGDGLTVNYHSPSGSHNQGGVPGVWSGAYHTYGLYRAAGHADVYWDGQLVKTYPTDDNGQPQTLIFNVGGSGIYGAGSQVLVDWVRAWAIGAPPVATTPPTTTTTPPPPTSKPPVTTTATTQPPTTTPPPAPDPWAAFWQWVAWFFGHR